MLVVKRYPFLWAVIAGWLLLLSMSFLWANEAPDQKLKEVQADIDTLSGALKKKAATKAKLYQQLKKQSEVIAKLGQELYILNQHIQQNAENLQILKQKQRQQRKLRLKQLQMVQKQLRAAYISAHTSYLKALLNQANITKISRFNIYFHYFHQARQKQLYNIDTVLQRLISNQKKLTIAQARQKQLYNNKQKKQKKLQESNQLRTATLDKLDVQLNNQNARLTDLREQKLSLQALLASLSTKKVVIDAQFAKNKGVFPWPIKGNIAAHYGSSRNLGTMTWQGLMIKAPVGAKVITIGDGHVVFSGWLRGFGLLLIIDHGDQYMTLYGNNQSLLKKVGDIVSAGEPVALSGEKLTGQYGGLYFEIRHAGIPTNPIQWLDKQS